MKHWSAVVWLIFGALPGSADERPPAPLYTNDDLERVRPLREQTGVASRPAAAAEAPREAKDERPGRGESYWRREAERLDDRLRPLRARVADLRRRIEERWSAPNVRTLSDPRLAAWQRDLAEVEAAIRELEARFEERARRAGALPGWLR